MMNIGRFVAFLLNVAGFSSWATYVVFNAYVVHAEGQRALFWMFLMHSFLLLMMVLLLGFIPVWEEQINDYIFQHPTLCDLLGFLMGASFAITNLTVTAFNFSKIQFYKDHFHLNAQKKYLFGLVRIGLILWVFILLPLNIHFLKPGANPYAGDNWCAKKSSELRDIYKVSTALYVIMNFIINYLVFSFQSSSSDVLSQLQGQLKLNTTIIPSIFGSSVVLKFLSQIMVLSDRTLHGMFWGMLIFLFDQILNNVCMYLAIYTWCPDQDTSEEEEAYQPTYRQSVGQENTIDVAPPYERTIVDAAENDESSNVVVNPPPFQRTTDPNDRLWIDIAGGHPIQVTRQLVDENRLWKHIVTDPVILRSIPKYQRYGFVPSLWHFCTNMKSLNAYVRESRNPDLYE